MAEPGPGRSDLRAAPLNSEQIERPRPRLSWEEYSAAWAGLHLDVDPRRSSAIVRGWLRMAYLVGRGLVAARLSPGGVTALGLLFACATPVVVLRGWWFFVGVGLVLLSAVADSADGAVAVMTRRTSRLGAFDDSLADRVSEAAWLLALWLVGGHGLIVVLCGAVSWLHEYARARAVASGMTGIGVVTTGERPTRVIAVVAALLLGGIGWRVNPALVPGAVTVVLTLWALLGLLGLLRLLGPLRAGLRRRS